MGDNDASKQQRKKFSKELDGKQEMGDNLEMIPKSTLLNNRHRHSNTLKSRFLLQGW